ncbi:hypothetical protein [Curtobacterium sp. MCPF17_001]|uniref:hypothetical protein n=1 Tax=Curtobacterium sp. MCPF17_001 TaxID=2175651 RepID=UPI0011B3F4A4|nr:hypothetical protein [Curtobacterium sp. MCPF17_001]
MHSSGAAGCPAEDAESQGDGDQCGGAAGDGRTACTGGADVEPADAEKSIVSIVDETTRSVGGHWTVYSEPTAESCAQAADDGLTYTYILMQDAPPTDPAEAVAAVEQLWKDEGITTQRYQTGAADPILGVRGRGGPVTSMDFLADGRRFSVVGVSECAEGSAVEERKRRSTSSPTP